MNYSKTKAVPLTAVTSALPPQTALWVPRNVNGTVKCVQTKPRVGERGYTDKRMCEYAIERNTVMPHTPSAFSMSLRCNENGCHPLQ